MDLAQSAWLLTATAAVFATINGVNDGSTLLALGSRVPGVPILLGYIPLVGAVVFAPVVIGTAVTETFISHLVDFDDQLAEGILSAVFSAVLIVLLLSRKGVPTSLTVATLGGLVGSGVGRGLDVQWVTVALVLLVASLTPAVGALVAIFINRAAEGIRVRRGAFGALRVAHAASYSLQCAAYGANDGQKMLAVYVALGLGTASGISGIALGDLLILGFFFALGTLIGLRRYALTLGHSVLPVRPLNAVVAESSSALVVLGTALAGSPVSTTQSMVGGLIGSGLHEGYRRIRWESAASIVSAWLYTFPLTFVVGGLISWLIV